jgi:uncharacterized protein involved in exopolysaccharide biosynthesis
METIIQNPTLAFIAVIVTGILASLPGLYAAWTQRKRIRAETVREEAEAAEIISKAYTQLQESYVDMIAAIKESYKECNDKMELLMTEVEELRKENKKLIKENEALCEQIKVLEQLIADLKDEVSKE